MTRKRRHSRALAWAPRLTLLIFLGPIFLGLLGTLAPAFGLMPAFGGRNFSLDPFVTLFDWPGISRATMLSIKVGVLSTLVSLAIAVLVIAGFYETRLFAVLQRGLAPLLSLPHAAAAFALAFMLAPSGWIARALSPWLTGWARPPDLLIVQDPAGLSLTLGLVAKEVPFLMLMVLAALPQARPAEKLRVARTLGYAPIWAWLLVVFPSVYRQIRLPVYAVLAYSMSVVDVAVILGPNTPPTLAVQVLSWMHDPDLSLRFPAAAGASLQLGLVVAAIAAWRMAEWLLARLGSRVALRGWRGAPALETALRLLSLTAGGALVVLLLAGLVALGLWSVAALWPFPNLLPDAMTLRSWERAGPDLGPSIWNTVVIATSSTLIALSLTISCLEAEHRGEGLWTARALSLLYLPLVIPQIAFLAGLQSFALSLGFDGGLAAVVLAHCVFVLPYVFLVLAPAWRAWDARFETVARALGADQRTVLFMVRLPMLLRPVLAAAAVGFAVSIGQYLPTVLIGAGRVTTLTTEAVALASGGDRRVIGVFAIVLTATALLPFFAATYAPNFIWRNRAGLRHG